MVTAEPQHENDLRKQWDDLAAGLKVAFDAAPVEDGETHAAEGIVARECVLFASIKPALLLEWMTDEGGEFAWSLLRCLGRSNVPVPLPPLMIPTQVQAASWRRELIRGALASDDVRVRDAAASALEDWEDPSLLDAFAGHREPVPWLRDYIAAVESDLAELTA